MSDGLGSAAITQTNRIVIPYAQRNHFKPVHASKKRFRFVVAHRRAGKSVSEINEIIKAAVQNQRVYPPPRYAYIGPTFAQTKDLIWGYLKHYTSVIPGMKYSEGDLQATFPNGAMINLYGGGQAYQRMRGLYFDGAVADEYPLLDPDMLDSVVRPCLADYRGFLIASGTSNGDDHFHELKKIAERNPDEWDIFIIPVTDTDALHPDEVEEMRRQMDPDKFAREMLCSFAAPVEGAYYADIMNELEAKGQIGKVPFDPAAPLNTIWDIGIHDQTFIIGAQKAGQQVKIPKVWVFTGKGFPQIIEILKEDVRKNGVTFGVNIFPPDIMARELGTGRSRYEIVDELLGDIRVCPSHRVEDGITAVRSLLPTAWIDKENAAPLIMALRNYHRGLNGKPVHNWASHGADSNRYLSVAWNHFIGSTWGSKVVNISGRLRRRLKGLA
jgi:hypothetical protein